MKKKYMMPLQRIAELDPKDGFLLLQTLSLERPASAAALDVDDSSKVKEERHFNSNGNIWDDEW